MQAAMLLLCVAAPAFATGSCICTNTCQYAHLCDDGGPGSIVAECPLGTDCDHCGPSDRTDANSAFPDGAKGDVCGGGGVEGDPFTTFQGKRVQFWLPEGSLAPLISHGDVTLKGEVIEADGAPEAGARAQQWFKRFVVDVAGRAVAEVARRDPASLLPARLAKQSALPAAEDTDDVAVAESFRSAMRQRYLKVQRHAKTAAAAPPLTTLSVVVDGVAVANADAAQRTGGALTVSVVQTQQEIGSGHSEVVYIDAGGNFSFTISSSVASKFSTTEARLRHLHLDLAFTAINAKTCTGLLPEIWGVQAMTGATARALMPTQ